MSVSFLTNVTEVEFKQFLRQSLVEIINELGISNKPETRDILDIKQASDFLRLKLNTLYEKTSQKIIPHFKKGNKLYFNRAELQAWVADGKVKTTAELQVEASSYTLHKEQLRISTKN
jgi:excisionase family DNA binding protein